MALVSGFFCANLLLIHWRVPEEAVLFLAPRVGLTAVSIGIPFGADATVVRSSYLPFGLSQIDCRYTCYRGCQTVGDAIDDLAVGTPAAAGQAMV